MRGIGAVGLGILAAAAVALGSPTVANADPTLDLLCNSGSAEFCVDPAQPPVESEPETKSSTFDNPLFPGCPTPGTLVAPGSPYAPQCPTAPLYPVCPHYQVNPLYQQDPLLYPQYQIYPGPTCSLYPRYYL